MAILIGSNQGTVSDWERGKANPRADTIKRLAVALEINAEWVLTGEGAMESNPIIQVGDLHRGVNPTSHLRDLETKESDILPPGAFEVRWIPTLGLVPGGPPFEPDMVPLGMLPVPVDIVKHPRAFALKVMGSSMSPLIDDGDIIACEPYEGERLAPGTIVVAMVQGESTVKLYLRKNDERMLIAISGSTKPIYLREGDYIFAVVKLVSRPPDSTTN